MDNLTINKKRKDMYRRDGSKKSGTGFLGPHKNKVDGGTMTEVSIEFEDFYNGQQIPAMVPTLTPQEIKHLQNMKIKGNARNIPQSIKRKALDHARIRIQNGLSPFYQDGE